MARFNSKSGRAAAYKRNLIFTGRGRYIVAYQLNRKNAARHECFRAKTIADCMKYIQRQKYTDRYYKIYDYNWQEVTPE